MITSSANAKTFYGKMKDEMPNRQDLQSHYKFNHKIGGILRYAPSEYQIVGLAGITLIDFVAKEVIWDACLSKVIYSHNKAKQGHFDMTDAAANFKGLKDGINGRDFIKESEFTKLIANINSLTKNMIIDNSVELQSQKDVIDALQKRLEILESK